MNLRGLRRVGYRRLSVSRKLRFAVVAALLAILFGFVTVSHARVHSGERGSETACAMCQHAAAAAPAPIVLQTPVVAIAAAETPNTVVLAAPSTRAHATRGPPAA